MTTNTNTCGWWAFAPGGFHTEAYCALAHGHAGDHHDHHGDMIDMPTDAERIGAMCATYDEENSGTLCAREPGHAGQCRNRAGYVFDAGTDTREDAPERACILDAGHDDHCVDSLGGLIHSTHTRTRAMGRTDMLVFVLTHVLNNPGPSSQASTVLSKADKLFGALDARIKSGERLPSAWRVTVGDAEDVTARYDACSEELRTRGGVVAARQALVTARGHWNALVAALRAGAPLPSPWQRAE